VEDELLRRDDEKPWLVTVKFTYAPDTYANDTKVYFTFTAHDGTNEKKEAEKQNEAFVLQTELDLTAFESATISINDGTQTQTQDCTPDLVWEYLNASGNLSYLQSADSRLFKEEHRYSFTTADGEPNVLQFYGIAGDDLQKARLVFLSVDNKEVYSSPLTVQEVKDGKTTVKKEVSLPPVSFNTKASYGVLRVRLELTDSKGVRYVLPNEYDDTDEITTYTTDALTLVFTVDGKEVTVSNS